MERSAAADDLVTCPTCRIRNHLVIRWIPEIDHRVHERTDVGCRRCELWRAAKETRWAFAEWNHWACGEWAKLGHTVPFAELYRLLLIEAHREMAGRAAAHAVGQYLSNEVASRCAWKVGDRFETQERPKGIWSVRSVEPVYGTNTGPFCILKCRSVLTSGILGGSTHEFWDTNAKLKRLSSFWKPSTWRQVVVGDACVLAGKQGVVVNTDSTSRTAIVNVDDQELEVKRLRDLRVPLERIEHNDA
jgi:hypothetical protein